jgi:hypothetical protein
MVMAKKNNPPSHQFGHFGFIRPVAKVPISAERIQEAKALYNKGDIRGSASAMREVREGLEAYEARIFSGRKEAGRAD